MQLHELESESIEESLEHILLDMKAAIELRGAGIQRKSNIFFRLALFNLEEANRKLDGFPDKENVLFKYLLGAVSVYKAMSSLNLGQYEEVRKYAKDGVQKIQEVFAHLQRRESLECEFYPSLNVDSAWQLFRGYYLLSVGNPEEAKRENLSNAISALEAPLHYGCTARESARLCRTISSVLLHIGQRTDAMEYAQAASGAKFITKALGEYLQ